jgi:hypothetical protein
LSFGAHALPGIPVYFQYLYHDPAAGGSGMNLSSAISAMFYP